MKKANRFLAVLLSWALCLSLLPASVFAAEESEMLVIEAASVSGEAGQTVEVPIVITQNPGVVAFGVQIAYDSAKLELTSEPTVGPAMESGSITRSQYLTSNPYTVLFDSSTASANITATGTLMTMSFRIKENAAMGEIPINVSFAANSSPINFDLKDVPCSAEKGAVIVKAHTWGAATYTWSTDNTTCTAERSCICGSKETENGTVTSEVSEATCTDAGFVIYTAVFTNVAFETQVQAVTGEGGKGHTWGTPTYTWSTDNTTCTAERSCICGSKETENGTVTSEVSEATCTDAGFVIYTAVFTNVAFETQVQAVTGEGGKGHTWGTSTYTWSTDNATCTAEHSCICGAQEQEIGTVSSVSTGATCTEAGQTVYTAVFTNPAFAKQEKTIKGVIKGHTWGSVTYHWNANNTVCTAQRECGCGASEAENATASGLVIHATCTEAGKTVFTAVFTNSAFTKQEKTVAGVSAKGHAWGTWETVMEPTADQPGEARRVCSRDESHVQTRRIIEQVCCHTCTLCGKCTEETCGGLPKCICGEESAPLETKPLETYQISVDTSNMIIPEGQTIQVIANEVSLPGTEDNTMQFSVNPYEDYILGRIEGYSPEKVYEIHLQVKETGEIYWLAEGETATVRLFVGTENAEAIDQGKLFLAHLSADGTEIYGKDQVQAELQNGTYTGYIFFTTDDFSPFVLVSKPAELSIELNATTTAYGCDVEIMANQSFRCDLYLAAYDINGRMLGAKVISSSNLGAKPQYSMQFSGAADCVKAFMTEVGSFTLRCMEAMDRPEQ